MPAISTETAILDRWESGQSCRLIAHETGFRLARVEKIVRNTGCTAEDRRHRTRMAIASQSLREAILRTAPMGSRA